MTKIIGSPTRYIQGKGELERFVDHASTLGNRIFIIIDKNIKDIVLPFIEKNLEEKKVSLEIVDFNGECSKNEINRLKGILEEKGGEIVAGIGGGKTHDTAKAVAFYAEKPVIIVPTIASTDAPCSSLSVIYTDDGVFEEYLFLPSSPNIVLIDSDVVSNAPARLLAAGIGDALATYYEARACQNSGALNMFGGHITKTAMALAELCYNTLIEDSVKAYLSVEEKVCTKAVENIIEANTYLSGIGFESGGLAAAHAIHNGLTVIEEAHNLYHGEKVAFGTLVQLVLENAPIEEIEELIFLCQELGLPTTLEDLNIKEVNNEKIMEVAKLACAPEDTMGNMPFEVKPEDVYAAIMGADSLGKYYR
ncbi:glycerol dehydrogenase [Miniphocaeibacter halophilus]|uniref:Glycerol dehydrogenase n=1 Tax=Miniphocaeibacter halophilus TaxID=2931922 RepID=A0AC61MT77_9FIRM|nr:glycerol dehydrogenase [Miniphocaeibacter halophilus]QQK08024.1 glycerol dehydrogenase [Miniphocaeibacter halophilus]